MLRHATRTATFARNVAGKRVAPAQAGALRFLNLHEYQSRDLMEQYGVKVQKGQMADTADAAFEVASRIKKESAYAREGCGGGRFGRHRGDGSPKTVPTHAARPRRAWPGFRRTHGPGAQMPRRGTASAVAGAGRRGRRALGCSLAFQPLLTPILACAPALVAADPGAELILKAQIHAGGRGKGTFKDGMKGGVKICTECERSPCRAACGPLTASGPANRAGPRR